VHRPSPPRTATFPRSDRPPPLNTSPGDPGSPLSPRSSPGQRHPPPGASIPFQAPGDGKRRDTPGGRRLSIEDSSTRVRSRSARARGRDGSESRASARRADARSRRDAPRRARRRSPRTAAEPVDHPGSHSRPRSAHGIAAGRALAFVAALRPSRLDASGPAVASHRMPFVRSGLLRTGRARARGRSPCTRSGGHPPSAHARRTRRARATLSKPGRSSWRRHLDPPGVAVKP